MKKLIGALLFVPLVVLAIMAGVILSFIGSDAGNYYHEE